MVTPELLEFIRAQFQEGFSKQELVDLLVAEGGWNTVDLDEAFREIFDPLDWWRYS